MNGWRYAAAAIPILALTSLQLANAAEGPASAPATESKSTTAPAPQPSEAPASWTSDLLAPLREFGVESWWDVLRFGQWSGSLGLTLDSQRQRLTSPLSPSRQTQSDLATEGITIRNDGIVLIDPRLFTASISLGYALEQQRMSADSISQWARACIDADAIIGGSQSSYPTSHDLGVTVSTEELRAAYTGYCKQQNLHAVNLVSFGMACTEMFGPRRRLKAQPNSKRRPHGYDVPTGKKGRGTLDKRLGIV